MTSLPFQSDQTLAGKTVTKMLKLFSRDSKGVARDCRVPQPRSTGGVGITWNSAGRAATRLDAKLHCRSLNRLEGLWPMSSETAKFISLYFTVCLAFNPADSTCTIQNQHVNSAADER